MLDNNRLLTLSTVSRNQIYSACITLDRAQLIPRSLITTSADQQTRFWIRCYRALLATPTDKEELPLLSDIKLERRHNLSPSA